MLGSSEIVIDRRFFVVFVLISLTFSYAVILFLARQFMLPMLKGYDRTTYWKVYFSMLLGMLLLAFICCEIQGIVDKSTLDWRYHILMLLMIYGGGVAIVHLLGRRKSAVPDEVRINDIRFYAAMFIFSLGIFFVDALQVSLNQYLLSHNSAHLSTFVFIVLTAFLYTTLRLFVHFFEVKSAREIFSEGANQSVDHDGRGRTQ